MEENKNRKRIIDIEYRNKNKTGIMSNIKIKNIFENINLNEKLNELYDVDKEKDFEISKNSSKNRNDTYLYKRDEYYNLYSKYYSDFDNLNIHHYNYTTYYYDNKNREYYVFYCDNEDEIKEELKYDNFYVIEFSSQTEYTIKDFGIYDFVDVSKIEYSYKSSSYESMVKNANSYVIVENLVDQAIIKTLTNYEYNIEVYDKVMDQKEEIFVFSNNPVNLYFPYIILFFFM